MAAAGVVLGASGAYMAGKGAAAEAARGFVGPIALREAPLPPGADVFAARARLVEQMISGGAPERFEPPAPTKGKPKIIIVFDDMGIDKAAYEQVMKLPGPLTLSFLPYADGLQPLVDRASASGHEIMLHLPMQPNGAADPGPHALAVDMTGSKLLSELDWNMKRIEGYVGVNNHMGSRFTRNEASMKTVLSVLAEKGLFFLDSVTTGETVATVAGHSVGATVFARDVFLDPEAGSETVMRQLALVERIAEETGFAVAICHPRPDTLKVIGPWLTSAPSRGFELEKVSALIDIGDAWSSQKRVASAGGK